LVLVKKEVTLDLQGLNTAFPPGSRVVIREPFYKVLADGMLGVRLEGDVALELTTLPPSEIERLEPLTRIQKSQADGNALFKADDFRGAIDKYTDALKVFGLVEQAPMEIVPKDEFEVHKLYSNRAACYIKTADYELALSDADAAIQHCPTFTKAYARRLSALGNLKRQKDAATMLLELPELSLTDSDRAYFDEEAAKYMGFPSHTGSSMQLLTDPRVILYEQYVVSLSWHVYKCVMSSYFTASHRRSMTLTEDGSPADMNAEEAAEDLQNRTRHMKSEEDVAKRVMNRCVLEAQECVDFLNKKADFSRYKPSSVTKIQEAVAELNALISAHK
jgi:tetratricopeptide (TPR) repeat protein